MVVADGELAVSGRLEAVRGRVKVRALVGLSLAARVTQSEAAACCQLQTNKTRALNSEPSMSL